MIQNNRKFTKKNRLYTSLHLLGPFLYLVESSRDADAEAYYRSADNSR